MIELLNVKEGDIYEQSLIHVFGKCEDTISPRIEITDKFGKMISWKIVNNYFKVTF
jgi:hypothetical protein